MIGRTVSHYRILEEVGHGGMGVVYKALDTTLERIVALKFLPDGLKPSESAKSKFLREARAASSLNHPNVCQVYDVQDAGSEPFIVMEFIEGETLRDVIGRKPPVSPLPVAKAIELGIQIAEGLSAAHAKGIVHQDIKPENIIVTRGGKAKITDFGLAKTARESDSGPGPAIAGTIAYMSPEQLRGEAVGPAADIWSFGVVLYEMITGHAPFEGEYEQAVMYSIINERHRPVSAGRRSLPSGVAAVVDRCLEKHAGSRFAAIEECRAALRQAEQASAPSPQRPAKSIAVMPFQDLSPGKDNQYFSDGLTEEIIASISKLQNMKIVSRSSVSHYDRSGKSLKTIAADLGVTYLLEGSVRKQGADLRITAELVDAEADSYLWADKYSGTMDDIFEIQEQVASKIVKALKVRLSPGERKSMRRRSKVGTEAYELYLKGRFFWNKRSDQDFRIAIKYFEQAIEIDGKFALAWAGLADSYNLLSEYGKASRSETYAKARAAAEVALELDEGLAEAHTALACLIMVHEWKWAEAFKEFKRSLKLNPNYPTTHHWFAEWHMSMGKLDVAVAEFARARELDPLSPAIVKDKGLVHYYAGQYDEAVDHARKALELEPAFSAAHRLLSLAYLGKGLVAEALRENEIWGTMTGLGIEADLAKAYVLAVSGRAEEARTKLDEILRGPGAGGNGFRSAALVFGALGEADRAMDFLEKAYEVRADSLTTLKIDRKLDPLRSNPRFRALLKKVGLDQ